MSQGVQTAAILCAACQIESPQAASYNLPLKSLIVHAHPQRYEVTKLLSVMAGDVVKL